MWEQADPSRSHRVSAAKTIKIAQLAYAASATRMCKQLGAVENLSVTLTLAPPGKILC